MPSPIRRLATVLLVLTACVLFLSPGAFAQSDGWQVDVAPFYFWAATTSGNLAVNERNVPVYVSLGDALSRLAGAFSVHGEARNARWGVIADYYFIRLSTDISYTTPILPISISGSTKQDEHIFDGAVTFWFRPDTAVVGGVRTFTLAPSLHFNQPIAGQTDFSFSKTAVAAFGGIIYRPRLGKNVVLLTRADIGGGSAFTWSATGGIDFEVSRLIGLIAEYHALGIDTGNVQTSGPILIDHEFSVTQYGPVFAVNFHWGEK